MTADIKKRLATINALRLSEITIINAISCVMSYFILRGHFVDKIDIMFISVAITLALVCIAIGVVWFKSETSRKSDKTDVAWYDTLTLMSAPLLFSIAMRLVETYMNV